MSSMCHLRMGFFKGLIHCGPVWLLFDEARNLEMGYSIDFFLIRRKDHLLSTHSVLRLFM